MFLMLYGFPPFFVDFYGCYGREEKLEIYKLIQKGFIAEGKDGFGAWFPGSAKVMISNEAKDLIAKLLQFDLAKRLTAKEALQHEWIVNQGRVKKSSSANANAANNADDAKENDTEIESISKMKHRFVASIGFKNGITRLFRDKFDKLKCENFNGIFNGFREIDTDNDGTIDFKGFKAGLLKTKELGLTEEDIDKVLNETRVDMIRKINYESLVNTVITSYLIDGEVRMYEVFRELDDTESGKIQTMELTKRIVENNYYGKSEELLKVINSNDLDNDGTIDYEEFLRAAIPDIHQKPHWFGYKGK